MNKDNIAVTILLNILKWIVLGFFFVVSVVPLVWLLLCSFKTTGEIQISPFRLPEVWQFVNYANAVKEAKLFSLFGNSVLVAIMAVGLNLLVTSMAAFAISRQKFPGHSVLMTIFTAGILVPIISFMVPYYLLIRSIGLYDNLIALGLTYAAINIPISMFLITSFMDSIPFELEEAAVIDGCNFFQRYTRVVGPLSRTGLVTSGTLCFIWSWNEFIMALLMTSSESSRTLQLGIRFFTSQFVTDLGGMYAAIVIAVVPSILIYILLHNMIISGLTAGAVKG